MKESWKTVNELLNKRSKSCNIDCLKDSGNAIDLLAILKKGLDQALFLYKFIQNRRGTARSSSMLCLSVASGRMLAVGAEILMFPMCFPNF